MHSAMGAPRPVCTFGLSWGTKALLRRLSMELLQGREKVENLPIVLVVEDDALMQGIVEDSLKEGGFETAIAPSAEEAVTLLKGKVMDYRVLVTDINLKGRMNGWEVARQAREINPTFPIVFMTGVAANDWPSHGVPNSVLLEKPFAPAQLVTAVSQLLNVPPSQR
jgi:DNA-binding response OmpR family regulator